MEMISLVTILYFFIVLQSNSATESSSLTIVGSNGTDDLKCLDGGTSKPCLTLGYVFNNIHHLTCDNCTVLVTYSHEIEVNSYGYNLTYQNLTIIGINSTTIVTKDRGSLQFSGNGTMNMKGIVWCKCGSNDSCLIFYYLYTVEIESCSFKNSTGIALISVLYVLINKCEFHNNTLTSGWNAAVLLQNSNLSVSITNSIFQTNQGTLIFTYESIKDAIICNCSFEDNTPNPALGRLIVIVILGHLEVKWCNFINNAYSIISIENDIDNITDAILISNNIFSHNYIPSTNIITSQSALLELLPETSVINISSNNFTSNRGTGALINLYTEDNKGITCSLENLYFFNNMADQTLVAITSINITMISTHFTANIMSFFNSENTGVISVTNGTIEIENCVFVKNKNTPLSLKAAKAWFTGENMFNANFALKGGAISADQNSLITVFQYGNITFRSNLAYYGGAIYIGQNTSACVVQSTWEEPGSYIFLDNKAITEGSSIFSSTQWCDCFQNLSLSFDEKIPIISSPSVIQPTLNQSLKLFPGQLIKLEDWNVTDCAGNHSSCTADVLFLCSTCDAVDEKPFSLHLIGPPTVFLINGTIDTGLKITASLERTVEKEYVLYFQCRNTPLGQQPVNTTISVEITKCPLGLLFNATTQVCECEHHNSKFLCSDQLGLACIEKGYWY